MLFLFSHSVMFDSLQPLGFQHTRLPCPSPSHTHVHWVSDAIQPSHPLSPTSPPALNLSQHQGLLQWVGSSHQVAKYWSLSFSISPSNEFSGLIFFRIDWFDLLAVQGTLKSLLQHHSSKASVLWCSAFFMALLSHLRSLCYFLFYFPLSFCLLFWLDNFPYSIFEISYAFFYVSYSAIHFL